MVAVSDSGGAIYRKEGFDYEKLSGCKREHGTVCEIGEKVSNKELLSLDIDILIPAALEGVITEENAGDV